MSSNVWVSKPYRESYKWLLESMPPLLARTTAFTSGTITQSERQTLAGIDDKQKHNETLLTYLERSQENYPCLVDIVTETGCKEVLKRLREALPPTSPQSPQPLASASAAEWLCQPPYPVQHTLAHQSQPGLLQGPPPQLKPRSQSQPQPLPANEDASESAMECYASTDNFGAESASHQGSTTYRRQPVQRPASLARSSSSTTQPKAVHKRPSCLYAGSSGSLSRAPLAELSNNRPVVSNIGDGISTTVSRRGGDHSLNLKVIGSIVKSVQAHREAKPFAQPVSLKDVPDYLEIVEEPMDFGTIRSRLTHMDYHYVQTVLKDVHLVFHNCYIYSDESTDTYKSGLELERYFLKLLKTQLKDYFPCYTIALV